MSLSYNPELADVANDGYVSGTQSVGTTQVEAKVGGSRQSGRELLYIENQSSNTVYYGPSGVTTSTGARLFKDQFVFLEAGENVAVFLIAGSASNTVLIQEMA